MRRTLRREIRQSPFKRWVWAELDKYYQAALYESMNQLVYGDMSGPFAEGLRHGQ